jgi:1-deoxy-D-xylulose-5-phosphate reductoisomerase
MSTRDKTRIIILGCSGSIGTTALNGLDSLRDSFDIVGISVHTDYKKIIQIANSWNVKNVCITSNTINKSYLDSLKFGINRFWGQEGLLKMIQETEADVVLNGISGSSGLVPTFAAVRSNKHVALANKESVVMAGRYLLETARKHGVSIYPVDSEHSALHQLIDSHGKSKVKSLIITASGGPFRELPLKDFYSITPQMAINHPTWKMGAKISVDSATLANKGLEVIEASYLFGFNANEIEVLIHPQSIIHSMIRLHNGAVYAQLSPPDMSLPILSALSQGTILLENAVKPLDFTNLNLSFFKPDLTRFPLLKHAFDCVQSGGAYSIAYNAANEVAVQAFLTEQISFNDIQVTVEAVLQKSWSFFYNSLDDILQVDSVARSYAKDFLSGIKKNKRIAIS